MIARKRSCSASRTRVVVAKQVAGVELQVLEVERRLALLRGGVLGGEAGRAAPAGARCRALRARRAPPARAGCAPPRNSRRARRAPRRPARSSSRSGFGRRARARRCAAASCLSVASRSAASSARLGVQLGEPLGDVASLLAELERQRPARRAKRLVDAGEHLPEPLRAVGREQPQPFGVAGRAERRERTLERLAAQHRRRARRRARGSAGRCPTANGCARRSREQKPWIVEIHAPSSRAREIVPAALRAAPRGCARAARRPPCACR